MFERMLAAVDDSARSSLVAEAACALAHRSGGALTLLRVRSQADAGAVSGDDLELAERTRELRAAGIAAHYLIHIGSPERQIIETAERQRASLIIVGARGAGLWPPRRQRMSQRLLVSAPAPLLVIPVPDTVDQPPQGEQPGEQPSGQPGDRIFGAQDAPILVALDGSDLAERSLPVAMALARLLDRLLVLLRVASPLDTEQDRASAWASVEAARRRVREHGGRDLRVETQVVSGATVEELLWAIEGRRAGALVLTALGATGDERAVASQRHASPITRELLSKLPIPALVMSTVALAKLSGSADPADATTTETERIR